MSVAQHNFFSLKVQCPVVDVPRYVRYIECCLACFGLKRIQAEPLLNSFSARFTCQVSMCARMVRMLSVLPAPL